MTISCQPDGRPPQPVRLWKSGCVHLAKGSNVVVLELPYSTEFGRESRKFASGVRKYWKFDDGRLQTRRSPEAGFFNICSWLSQKFGSNVASRMFFGWLTAYTKFGLFAPCGIPVLFASPHRKHWNWRYWILCAQWQSTCVIITIIYALHSNSILQRVKLWALISDG